MGKKCIGVDVGGTSVKLGIFDVDGVLLKKWEIPTRKEEQGKYVLDDIAASIRVALSATFPHLAKSSCISVIAALCRDSV